MTRPFAIDLRWLDLLAKGGVRPADVLRRAEVPEDLFSRPRPSLAPDGFLRLWRELAAATDDAPGLALAQAVSAERLEPQLFASLCCPNLTAALERLADFKPLIGPLQMEVHDTLGGLEVTFGADAGVALPPEFIGSELASFVHLARAATAKDVRPIAVEMETPPASSAYADFFGRAVHKGPFNRVVFTREDARRPFLSPDPALFASFEPQLRFRLDELPRGATMAERVRSVLMEALPGGQGDTASVAQRLGVSGRSLQRKLAAEKTSFQSELRALRRRLSEAYLSGTALSSAEVALLVGYDDPNSFIRAFHIWTDTTPEAYRSAARTT